jgi:hypothetical protein
MYISMRERERERDYSLATQVKMTNDSFGICGNYYCPLFNFFGLDLKFVLVFALLFII